MIQRKITWQKRFKYIYITYIFRGKTNHLIDFEWFCPIGLILNDFDKLRAALYLDNLAMYHSCLWATTGQLSRYLQSTDMCTKFCVSIILCLILGPYCQEKRLRISPTHTITSTAVKPKPSQIGAYGHPPKQFILRIAVVLGFHANL